VKTKTTLLFLSLILCACSKGVFTPQVLPTQTPTDTPQSPTPTSTLDASSTQCGYQWAYQDMPELTAQFDSAIKILIPNSISHTTVFGENCIGNDGQIIRFLAMETDFYVIVSVEKMDDYETFGSWITQVMQVVSGLPPDAIAGSKLGFIEFKFEKSTTDSVGFRVPIQGYAEATSGKNGEELFRLFYKNP